MNRLLPLLLALLLLVPCAARAGDAKVIILAHAMRQDATVEPTAAAAAVFKRQVEQASGGRLRVEIFPAEQLGGNRDMTRLASSNVIQSAIVTAGGVVPLYPPLAVTGVPFAIDRLETAYALYDGPYGQSLAAAMSAATELQVLGFGDTGGFHVLTNARRELRSPAGVAGLKFRSIPGQESLRSLITTMGGRAVEVSSREEYSAAASGLVDGLSNPIPLIVSQRYDGVQTFVTLTNHLYVPSVWVFNKAFWQSLTAEEQDILSKAVHTGIVAGRDLSRDLLNSDRGLSALRKRMQVYQPSPAERAVFVAATQTKVAEAIAAKIGPDGPEQVQAFLAAVAAAGGAAVP